MASAALEALRLHSLRRRAAARAGRHHRRGRWADACRALLGFTGATLLLLTAVAVGWSLFTGISWLRIAELTGFLLESGYALARGAWERRRDEKIGEQAREERETVVAGRDASARRTTRRW